MAKVASLGIQLKLSKMSLPGLDLSAPVETDVVPAVHELPEGSEWRFEVAFDKSIEVRVCPLSLSPPSHSLSLMRKHDLAPLRQR